MVSQLASLYRYRGFIVGSIRRDLTQRYRASALGAFWLLAQPVAMVAIYTLVFSQVLGARMPGGGSPLAYGIFVCAGVCLWTLVSEAITRLQAVFVEHAHLIKKQSFPRAVLPVIAAGNAASGCAIFLGLFLAFTLAAGSWPGWAVLAVAPVLATALLMAAGLGLLLGVLNVFFRDVGHLVTVILPFWFWLTPIVYPLQALPDWARRGMSLNPLAGVAEAFQQIFLQGAWPQWHQLVPAGLLGLAAGLLGLRLLRRHGPDMADEV